MTVVELALLLSVIVHALVSAAAFGLNRRHVDIGRGLLEFHRRADARAVARELRDAEPLTLVLTDDDRKQIVDMLLAAMRAQQETDR